MNIREALSAEHSLRQTHAIEEYIGSDPKRFRELLEIFVGGDRKLAQRAGWPLSYCVQHHPEIAAPHLERLIKQLDRDDVHPAVIRNVARLLQYVEIPEKLKGLVLEKCFAMVDDPKVESAPRCYAMTTAAAIAKNTPLMNELELIIDKHAAASLPSFMARARHVLAEK